MPLLSSLNLPLSVFVVLEPLVGDKLVGARHESVWIEKGRLRMDLEDIGEGLNGDFNEEDPDDQPLLRFSFSAKNEGEEELVSLDETSHCTNIDANAPWEVQLACACLIFDQISEELSFDSSEEVDGSFGRRAKRACEEASWASSSGYEELRAALQACELAQDLPSASSTVRSPRI